MHGTTKELQRLVKASALADRGGEWRRRRASGCTASCSRELAGRDPHGVRTRVVVDVVAGTSAGGINGVYLSKALAHNRSQDALRDLWLDRGDIKELLRGPGWLPRALKVPCCSPRRRKKPPLRGDEIAQWMYEALSGHGRGGLAAGRARDADAAGARARAVRHDDRFLRLRPRPRHRRPEADPRPRAPARAAFRLGDGDDQFSTRQRRRSRSRRARRSCFPGAFPPVSLARSGRYLEDGRLPTCRDLEPSSGSTSSSNAEPGRRRTSSTAACSTTSPSAMRSARSSGGRPSPRSTGGCSTSSPTPAASGGAEPAATRRARSRPILAAISGLPRKEPILDDILEVNAHNERVQRIRDIIEMTFDRSPSASRRSSAASSVGSPRPPSAEDDRPLARPGSTRRRRRPPGSRYATYLRSKVSGVVDRYARTICRLSDYPEDSQPGGVRPRPCCARGPTSACSPSATASPRSRPTIRSRSCAGSTSTTAPGGCAS